MLSCERAPNSFPIEDLSLVFVLGCSLKVFSHSTVVKEEALYIKKLVLEVLEVSVHKTLINLDIKLKNPHRQLDLDLK